MLSAFIKSVHLVFINFGYFSRRKFLSYRISISFTNGTKHSWIENHQLQNVFRSINLRLSRLSCYKCRHRVITTDRRTTITVAEEAVGTRKKVLHSCFSRISWEKRKSWASRKLEKWIRELGVNRQVSKRLLTPKEKSTSYVFIVVTLRWSRKSNKVNPAIIRTSREAFHENSNVNLAIKLSSGNFRVCVMGR